MQLACMQENDVEREFQIHRTEEDYALAEFYKWALAFLIGVAMGCIGFVVDWGIETLNDFKYYHTVSLIASRGAPPDPQKDVQYANMNMKFSVIYINVCIGHSEASGPLLEVRDAPACMTRIGITLR